MHVSSQLQKLLGVATLLVAVVVSFGELPTYSHFESHFLQVAGSAEPDIVLAAEAGNLDKLNLLILSHIDINVSDRRGRTALMAASFRGSAECLTALLRASAEVNARDKFGRTAVMYAVLV